MRSLAGFSPQTWSTARHCIGRVHINVFVIGRVLKTQIFGLNADALIESQSSSNLYYLRKKFLYILKISLYLEDKQ